MSGLLIGPYDRQVVGTRLKLWFAFRRDRDGVITRYEAAMDLRAKALKIRARPIYKGPAPQYAGAFRQYEVPSDLAAYPEMSYPRFPRDNLADAAISMLRADDIAEITRMRIGIPPTPQPANHGKQGELL